MGWLLEFEIMISTNHCPFPVCALGVPAAPRSPQTLSLIHISMLGLETPSNHDLTWCYPLCILLEWALITAVMVGLFYLCLLYTSRCV